ncbi:MAG: ATP-binding protein [Ktedonobacterales bacterium]
MDRVRQTLHRAWRGLRRSVRASVTSIASITSALGTARDRLTAGSTIAAAAAAPAPSAPSAPPDPPVAPAAIARRLRGHGATLTFVLLLFAVVLNGLIALRSFRLLVASEGLVSQTDVIEAHVDSLRARLLDARTSDREYLLTGDPEYLARYGAARMAVGMELARLQALTATDTAPQRQRITALRPLISANLAALQHSVALGAQRQPGAALAVLDAAANAHLTAATTALLDQLVAAEQQERDARLHAADQSLREVQMTMALATLAAIVLVLAFFVFVQRSLAARERHLHQEQQARATAEAAVALRDQFLSIASHELRTPITALLTAVTLLQRRLQGELARDEVQRQSFAVLRRQLARLDALIATMLDVTRIERGQLAPTWATVDLVALARTVVEEAQVTAEAHTIDVEVPTTRTLLVRGDALRLEQALRNVLQNAIKYSPAGGEVRVEAQRGGAWAALTVTDQGIGIPPEALPQLFDPYYRAPSVRSEHISGLGIGLYVTREIVALHGGEIAVSSAEGLGTTVSIRLPLLTADAENAKTEVLGT